MNVNANVPMQVKWSVIYFIPSSHVISCHLMSSHVMSSSHFDRLLAPFASQFPSCGFVFLPSPFFHLASLFLPFLPPVLSLLSRFPSLFYLAFLSCAGASAGARALRCVALRLSSPFFPLYFNSACQDLSRSPLSFLSHKQTKGDQRTRQRQQVR